jgi:O-antigen/teichoic acid export membrane protein
MFNTDSKQVVRNALASYVALLTQVISGILITPLLFRSLGASTFGTYALLVSISGYVGFLELGIGTATLRLVAQRTAAGASVRDVLGSSRALYRPIVAVSAAAFVPVAIFVPLLPGASGASAGQVRLVILSLGMGGLLGLLMNVYPAYIFGSGRSDVLFGLGAGTNLLLAASQAVVALAHAGIVLLAVVTAGVTAANTVLLSMLAKRMLEGVRARARDAERATKRHLMTFGLKNAGVAVMATVSQQSDVVIIGAILPAQRVAAYAIAARLAAFVKSIATRAADVLVPTFADAATRGETERQFRVFVDASLLGSAVLYPATLVVLLFGHQLLRVWLGAVPADTQVVLCLLVAAAAVQVLGGVAWVFFNARGELSVFLRAGSVVAVGNVAASIVLAIVIGVPGPAIATLLAIVVFDAVVLPRAVMRSLGRSPRELFAEVIRPLMLPLALAASVAIAIKLTLDSQAAGVTVAGAGFTVVVFYTSLWVGIGAVRRARYARLVGLRRTPALAGAAPSQR